MTSAPHTASDPRKDAQQAILIMAGINIIWGAAFPITKPALEIIPPFTFALLRFALALAILLPIAGKQAWALLRGPDGKLLIAMGIIGFCITQMAQTVALIFSPASDISLIATTTPIWVALLAWIWLGERMPPTALFGFALAIGGLVFMLWPQEQVDAALGRRILGDLIFLGSSLGWALYNLMGRALMARRSPVSATTAAGLVGTIGLLPFAAAEWWSGNRPHFSWIGVGAIAYTGILVTVVGFLALFWALSRAEAGKVAAMMYLQPLAGVVFAWLLLGEPITSSFLIGAAVVLLGVTFVSRAG